MRIKKLLLSQIRENDHNPNKMSPEIFNALVASIEDNGFVQPLLVKKSGDGYEIIDGAHRFRALRKLGYREVYCVIAGPGTIAAKIFTLSMNHLRGKMDNFKVAKTIDSFSLEATRRYLAYNKEQNRRMREILSRAPKVRLPKIPERRLALVLDLLLNREDAAIVMKAIGMTGEDARNAAITKICKEYLDAKARKKRRKRKKRAD